MGNVTARYIYADGDGARQNGVGQLATRLGANQDTSLPFSGSNVPEAIEELDSTGNVVRTLNLVTNQVGTVQLVTDGATGDVVQRLEYDAFGRVLFDSNPGAQPFGFAGGLLNADTGLVRFGARDYELSTGRWVSRDSITPAYGSRNAFGYAEGNPINNGDPSGLYFCNFTDEPITVGGGTRDSNGGDKGEFGTGTVRPGECVGPDNPVDTPQGPLDDVDVADLDGDGKVSPPKDWTDTWPVGEKIPWGDERGKGFGVWDFNPCTGGAVPLPM